jgi:hypothetical protein
MREGERRVAHQAINKKNITDGFVDGFKSVGNSISKNGASS